jgi:hypothetical protein
MSEFGKQQTFAARQHQFAEQEAASRRLYADAAAGLSADLAAAGFAVETLPELRTRGIGGPGAVRVLLKWLPTVSYVPLKLDVIHALAVPWARRDALRPLLDEFRRVDPEGDSVSGVRWSIGSALERIADDTIAEELFEIARDRTHGSARGFVVVALGNLKKHRADAVTQLIQLLDDDDVAGYAIMGLRKLNAREARPAIEPFLEHRERWVREEAKKACKKLDR